MKVKIYPSPYIFFKSSEVPIHCIVPFLITHILSLKNSASVIECVVKITLDFFFISLIIFQINLLLTGSNPVDGSSKNTTFGLPTVDNKILILLFIPPLKVDTLSFVTCSKLTSFILILTI